MVNFNQQPNEIFNFLDKEVYSFINSDDTNIDKATIRSFGDEWGKFSHFSEDEIIKVGKEYFDIINKDIINKDTIALDLGCGTGRWSRFLADKVGFIHAIDPSDAIYSAIKLNKYIENIRVSRASVDNIPFNDESFDFIFSLGVFHHIPDTERALKTAVKKLKKGKYILIYLYYDLDDRSIFYKMIFYLSDLLRRVISSMPSRIKRIICEIIAVIVYMPFILIARLIKFLIKNNFYKKILLSYYHDKSFNIIRNDTLDRFGTPLEKRFSKNEIKLMMGNAGLYDILFSDNEPYWHVIGKKL
jgi:SAM-dependent methyltransferase